MLLSQGAAATALPAAAPGRSGEMGLPALPLVERASKRKALSAQHQSAAKALSAQQQSAAKALSAEGAVHIGCRACRPSICARGILC